MSSQFTFIPIDLGKPKNSSAIAPDDRLIIRSLAARNPWNRPGEGETIVPGHRPPRRRPKSAPWPPKSSARTQTGTSAPMVQRPTPERLKSTNSDPSTPSNIRSLKLPAHIKSEQWDPFWCLPVPFRHFMSPMLNHRFTAINCYVPLLDDHEVRDDPSKWGMTRTWVDFRHSPAYIFTTLLFCGTQIRMSILKDQPDTPHSQHSSPQIATSEQLLWLHTCAIRALNSELNDPSRLTHPAKSSALLATVSMLATYEYNFGSPLMQRMHLKGCCQLIEWLGGFDCLDKLIQQFYYHVLRVLMIPPTSQCGPSFPRKFPDEYVTIAYEMRSVLKDKAQELGLDLDFL